MSRDLIELSKQKFNCNSDAPTDVELQTGCLQRIANATELMASNYVKLQKDYDYMKESRDKYRDMSERRDRTISALKGVITKLKNATIHNPYYTHSA